MAKNQNNTVPATVEQKALQVTLPASVAQKYKVGQRVTTPIHSLTHHGDLAFQALGEVVSSQGKEGATGKDKPMAVMQVRDLETGLVKTLIVPTVLESALRRVPGGYVGKAFAVVQGPKAIGKNYFQIELFELEG